MMNNILFGRLEQLGLLSGMRHFDLMQLKPEDRESWFAERRAPLRAWMLDELTRRFGDSEWLPADQVRAVIDRDPLTIGASSRATDERMPQIDPLTGLLSACAGHMMLCSEVRSDQVRAWINSAQGAP